MNQRNSTEDPTAAAPALLLFALLLIASSTTALEQPFSVASNLPLGVFNGASDIVAADIDGDGDLDIVAAAATSDKISWVEYDLQTGWTSQTVATAIDGAVSVAVGDLDLDGDLDIVGAARDAGTITWWENPSWAPQTVVAVAPGVSSLVTADMDGDGRRSSTPRAPVSSSGSMPTCRSSRSSQFPPIWSTSTCRIRRASRQGISTATATLTSWVNTS